MEALLEVSDYVNADTTRLCKNHLHPPAQHPASYIFMSLDTTCVNIQTSKSQTYSSVLSATRHIVQMIIRVWGELKDLPPHYWDHGSSRYSQDPTFRDVSLPTLA